MSSIGRMAFEAEKGRITAVEQAIEEAAGKGRIDFEAGRRRELARVDMSEPSALLLARERRRNAGERG